MQFGQLSLPLGVFMWLFFISFVGAFKIENGQISNGNSRVAFTCCKPAEQPLLVANEQDPIEIQFQVVHPETKEPYRPNQVVVVLSKQQGGLEQSLLPKVSNDGKASISIPIAKLSKNLLLSSPDQQLDVSVVVGDYAVNAPVVKKVAAFKVNASTISKVSKKYVAPTRYAAKPEIHHIFHGPAKQASPVVASVFIAIIGLILVWFVGTLLAHGSFNLKTIADGGATGLLYKTGFVGSIIALEVFFFQYYLGDSIFNLIFKSAILAGPGVWFGSRVFRILLQKRLSGAAK